eukprot:487984-Pelagomonas_calceolata.AAC.4
MAHIRVKACVLASIVVKVAKFGLISLNICPWPTLRASTSLPFMQKCQDSALKQGDKASLQGFSVAVLAPFCLCIRIKLAILPPGCAVPAGQEDKLLLGGKCLSHVALTTAPALGAESEEKPEGQIDVVSVCAFVLASLSCRHPRPGSSIYGNDILMLEGNHPAIVVGNAQPELLAWLAYQPQVRRMSFTQPAQWNALLPAPQCPCFLAVYWFCIPHFEPPSTRHFFLACRCSPL